MLIDEIYEPEIIAIYYVMILYTGVTRWHTYVDVHTDIL